MLPLAKYLTLFLQSIPFILVIVVIKYYLDKRRFFKLGSLLPGPPTYPIIGNALDWLGTKDVGLLGIIKELHQKYGSECGLVSFWLGHRLHVYISSPEHAEICFTSRPLHNHSEHYKFLEPALGKGLITANGSEWKKARKLMDPTFRYLSLENLINVANEKLDVLIQCLEKEEGKPYFSIYPYIVNGVFDIICELFSPICFNAQTQGTEILDHVDIIMLYMWQRTQKVWQWCDSIYKRSERGKDFYQRLEWLQRVVDPVIKETRSSVANEKEISKGYDKEILGTKNIVEQIQMEHPELDDTEIRDHVFTLIAAGYKTTTATISFVLIMLGIHRDVQEKLYNELWAAFNDGLQEKDLHRVKYLNMVIKETLRLYPALPLQLRKADEDVRMGKYLIPEGTAVGVNIFAIHRNPKVYENPEAFNPDNFLPENIQKRHPYSFVPFGMGPRKCIGARVAMTVIRVIVAKIVLNNEIECDLKMEDIKLKDKITLQMKDKFYPLRLIKRSICNPGL